MRKRKSSTRRRKNPSPAAARKRVTIRVNGKRGRRTTARRRRNPATLNVSQLAEFGLFGAGGAILTETAASFIPLAQLGPVGSLLGKAAVAYGIGYVAQMVGVSQPHATMIAAGGLVGVAKDVINQFVLPTVQGVFVPRPVPVAGGKGMNDIVALPRGSSDPYWGTSPNLGGLRQRAGLNNIVTVPRG